MSTYAELMTPLLRGHNLKLVHLRLRSSASDAHIDKQCVKRPLGPIKLKVLVLLPHKIICDDTRT